MLRSRIFPVLLLRGHGLVKTQKFDDPKYVGDPINAVKIFNEKEVDELTILDIDATTNNRAPDYELLKSIAAESRMPLCYGGGVKDAETAAKIISLGFEKISVSSGALNDINLVHNIAVRIGRQSTVVTLDIRKDGLLGKTRIFTHNGKKRHKADLHDFLKRAEAAGAGEIMINSIDRDGMMQGYDIDLAKRVRSTITTPLSIVGGAGSTDHIRSLVDEIGPVGAGAGSFFVFKGKYRAVLISYARP